ncbi:acyloxyacyl hydrolase [Nonlabens ponticola]|nr:acyloxyacyl hydrolase [Nonlabens ponticola]
MLEAIPLSRKQNPKKAFHYCFLAIAFSILAGINARAQEKEYFIDYAGLNAGFSRQDVFPYNNDNYFHESRYLKVQLGKEVWNRKKQSIEVLVEPSVYFVKHRMLNFFYIKPQDAENFMELRDRFLQPLEYEEYALNIGLIYRYEFSDLWSAYGQISIGPMIATERTERQDEGFSFSDIVGLGTTYRHDRWRYDLRFTLRHVSNADLTENNDGHNNAGIEIGVGINL